MLISRPSKVYISSLNVDMRKSIDGLAYIVEQKFKLPAQSDMMFVFHNRLKPFEYLEFLFENIRIGNDVCELVPWGESIPENMKKGE